MKKKLIIKCLMIIYFKKYIRFFFLTHCGIYHALWLMRVVDEYPYNRAPRKCFCISILNSMKHKKDKDNESFNYMLFCHEQIWSSKYVF